MSNTSKGRDNQGGSKDWMQQIINSDMRTQLEELTGEGETDWLLPLKKDDYSEYQLNQEPISKHFGFDGNTFSQWWPFPRQPQWDAIGKTKDGKLILVEAKAHMNETNSKCAATESSYALITKALRKTHSKLSKGAGFHEVSWLEKYYQTANRLLFWDNLRDKYSAKLIFLNFVNVPIANKNRLPATSEEWNEHMDKLFKSLLGYGVSNLPSDIKCVNLAPI